MKWFSRSKKGKEHTFHPDGVPERVSLSEDNIGSAISLNIRQPGQAIPSHPHASDRVEKHGLFLLNPRNPQLNGVEAQETYILDIVALHGIDGDAYKTWTHENGKLWLRDFVPKGLPGARVFSFGYPAEVLFSRGTDNLESYARSLLEDLKRERRKEVGGQFTSDITQMLALFIDVLLGQFEQLHGLTMSFTCNS